MDVFKFYEKVEKIFLRTKESGKVSDKDRKELCKLYDYKENFSFELREECIDDDVEYMFSFICSFW